MKHIRLMMAMLLAFSMFVTACSPSQEADSDTASSDQTSAATADEKAADDKAAEDKDSSDQADQAADKLEVFAAKVPGTMAFGAPMINFGKEGNLDEFAEKVEVGNWQGVDTLTALLSRKEAHLAATPAYVGANLYNKGIDVRLVAGVVWGMLYVLGPEDATPGDWEQLKGKKVGVPMPGNMPDLVFTHMLTENGMTKDDFEEVSVQQSSQIIGMLAKGEIDFAVIPEHAATMAIMKSKKAVRTITRALDLQEEWAKVHGGEPRIPMAGLVMPGELVDSKPELVGAVIKELEASAKKINALENDSVQALVKKYELPEPVVKQIIPRLQVNIVPAQEMRKEYEVFLENLGKVNPKIYGGKLPDDKFYAGK